MLVYIDDIEDEKSEENEQSEDSCTNEYGYDIDESLYDYTIKIEDDGCFI